MLNFQDMILQLVQFWTEQGCLFQQGYDLEVGAGTFNPATFLRSLGPEPYKAVYVEPSRRPKDGRYGENPNRVQHYFQMQVIMKPSPHNIQDLYLESLKRIGLNLNEHDIRFVHDDWENPTIGASGLGWEIWLDGMEVSQFTYFQMVGSLPVKPVSGEITYGLERLAMYLQGVNSIFDIKWNSSVTYGEIYKRSEWEWSHYNFNEANTKMWLKSFDDYEKEATALIERSLPIPAYDFVMKASHAFNILDSRGTISVTERTGYINRIRNLAKQLAVNFIKSRQEQSFPLLKEEEKVTTIARSVSPSSEVASTESQDFLLEIGSEELPASFVAIGMHNLEIALKQLLQKENLSFDSFNVYGTPRRLSVYIKGLACGTATQILERKGPLLSSAYDAQGKLTGTGVGFFKSIGAAPCSLKELTGNVTIKKIKEQEYLFATIEKKGISTRSYLAENLAELILKLDFPKKMRWGSFDFEYARPLRWLLALYGTEIIPFTLGNLISDRLSYGHRQLSPQSISLSHPRDYLESLKKHYVMADASERKKKILDDIAQLEKKENIHLIATEKVLPTVLHLVEWPFLTCGCFDTTYLRAPHEILILEMVEHQKYFPATNASGELQGKFAIVCNNVPSEKIRHGNERALSPRLSDGLFLYEEDLKTPLEELNERLKTITFQKELGSMFAKVQRLIHNVEILHAFAPSCDLAKAKRAATLAKADLASHVVEEFPELQGVMGSKLAVCQGESKEVARAIDEQWMPRNEKAALPSTPEGILLSLSDKIDNLLSCMSLGLIPTSSSDPYALRRQAFGIIKIVLENRLTLPLKKILFSALETFLKNPELSQKRGLEIASKKEAIVSSIEEFLKNRLKTIFLDMGFEKDAIESVLSYGLDDIYDRYVLIQTLQNFRKREKEAFLRLLKVDLRAKKILLSEKSDLLPLVCGQNAGRFPAVDPVLFQDESEKNLFNSLSTFIPHKGNYEKRFSELTALSPLLEELFQKVKILDENKELRTNRLALLQKIWDLCEELIDFGKIQEHDI